MPKTRGRNIEIWPNDGHFCKNQLRRKKCLKIEKLFLPTWNWKKKQAGAELCQAQVKLEVLVEFGVEVEVCYY